MLNQLENYFLLFSVRSWLILELIVGLKVVSALKWNQGVTKISFSCRVKWKELKILLIRKQRVNFCKNFELY